MSCIDEVWQKFWRCPNVDYSEYENLLPKDRFIALCSIPPIIEFVKSCDYQFYQFCVDALIPDVLRAIPGNFSQQIRNFAKSLENWLRNALLNIPEEMQQIKVCALFFLLLRDFFKKKSFLVENYKCICNDIKTIHDIKSFGSGC